METHIIQVPEQQIVIHNPEAKTIVCDWLEVVLSQKAKSAKVECSQSEFSENEYDHSALDLTSNKEIFQSKYFEGVEGLVEKGGFQITLTEKKTRFFAKVFEVFYDGVFFGTLCTAPHNPKILSPDSVFFKIENSFLYKSNWYELLSTFAIIFELKLLRINRLDVAADGFNFLNPVQLFHQGFIEKKGRAEWAMRGSKTNKPNGFNLGSMRSDKYVRVYNKQREIERHSKKYYVYQFWHVNGVKTEDFHRMTRIEATLKQKILKEYIGEITWSKIKLLTNKEKLVSLLASALENVYEWRIKRKTVNQNVSRLEKVCGIVWNCQAQLLKRARVYTAKKIRSFQITAKMAYQLYLKTGFAKYHMMALEIIENCNLEQWFDKRRKWWEYEQRLEHEKNLEFLPLFNYDTGQKVDSLLNGTKGMKRQLYM